jgi:hypothetical protein
MKSVMSEHDIADAGFIDVNGLSLSELGDEIDGSSLESALGMIFDPRPQEDMHSGFDSHI